ncbi:hypothetical protein PROFUN_15454 [Planoprotostelium fungivorum]|uniref:Uncharacterized protein n=1 Tax=Planoprotostelium fungivorum TaxID=1890364 RepID=A0A2P6MW39_9EUKA|nr:hypothetical protein PROFUN_15454 [Planoprotostelium fungivorum]
MEREDRIEFRKSRCQQADRKYQEQVNELRKQASEQQPSRNNWRVQTRYEEMSQLTLELMRE